MATGSASSTPSAPKVEAPFDPYAAERRVVTELNLLYEDVKRDDSDEGRRQRAQIGAKLARLTHDQIHPGEDYVELDVPPSVTGEPFRINDHEYLGLVTVPACEASTILHMIELNRKVDLDRMREGGRTMNLGPLADRARRIQGDV